MQELLAEKDPNRPVLRRRQPTVADICLVTQVTPEQLFNTNPEPFKMGHAHLRCPHGDPR
jgi:hypothetical protein